MEELKKLSEITSANRAAWNEAMPYHQRGRRIDYPKEFKDPGFSVLDKTETDMFLTQGIEGKRIAHVCCNNGVELLSIMTLGAAEGVGFDISDEAVREAMEFTKISGRNCRFVRTDAYEIDATHTDAFDFVYITVGGLAWLPDLPAFFRVISRILKPGGCLAVYDIHPFICVFIAEGDEGFNADNPYLVGESYFRKKPWIDHDGIDYIGGESYKSKTMYSYSMTVADILNSVIQSGIAIQEFHEYSHDKTPQLGRMAEDKLLPLSFMLVGRKN